MKAIWNWIVFIFTGKGKVAADAADEGLIDHSGQGRNKSGQ